MRCSSLLVLSLSEVARAQLCKPLALQCDGSRNIRNAGVASDAGACCALCEAEPGCAAWTWNKKTGKPKGNCWLKEGCGEASKNGTSLYVSGLGGSPAPTPPAPPTSHDAFHPGEYWTDTEGQTIDAHGAGLLVDAGKYYWYGETRHNMPSSQASCFLNHTGNGANLQAGYTPGINLYVNDGNLYNWKHIGLVFPANATGTHCLERPKVIKCPATGKYVLWAKGFPTDNTVRAVVATSKSPLGPFSLVDTENPFYSPGNFTFADATLYVDEEAQESYAYFRTRNNGFRVGKLSRDCTRLAEEPTYLTDKRHEAPAAFKYGGKFYLWTSGTTGFGSNPAQLLVSHTGSFYGPFVNEGNPTGDRTTFDSQSTYIVPNPAYKLGSGLAQFILLADRWQTKTENFGRYLWLPLVINDAGNISVTNPKSWRYEEPVAETVQMVV